MVWQVQSKNGRWHTYNQQLDLKIEAQWKDWQVCKEGAKTIEYRHINGKVFVIDFERMMVTDLSTGSEARVRRI